MRETQDLKIHELKIFEHFATDILAGRKTFEIRNDDRKFKEGDLVHFQAVSEENAQPVSHPINSLTFRIGYILRAEDFPGGIKDGFAIFTISPERKKKIQGKPLAKEDLIWWTNHIFNMAKEQAFNAGQMEDALEIQETQFEIVKRLQTGGDHH